MKLNGKKLRIHSICAAVLLIAATAYASEVVDRVVAVVNDDIISLFELNQIIKPYQEKLREMGYPDDKEREMLFKLREDAINKLIEQKITDQEVKRLNISVGEKEIDASVERIKEVNYMTDEQLREALSKEGLSLEEYRNKMREEILRARLVNMEVKSKIVITNEDIKAYYNKNPDKYGGEKKYHLRHILKKSLSFGSQLEKNAIKFEMQDILAKLKKGEPFEKAAAKYSDAPSASEGGELGTFSLNSLSTPIRDAVKSLKPGEFSDVVDTEQGYQIFFLQEVVDAKGKSVEEVKPEIEEKLYKEIVEQKFKAWLQDLRQKAHIRIIK
jgi:peptidyl-prolyl cis-trans isomerase SurA